MYSAALHAVTANVAQGLAYRTAVRNIAGQDAVASVVQRAAARNAKEAADEAESAFHDALDGYAGGTDLATVSAGQDMSGPDGQIDWSFWKDLVPGVATVNSIATAHKMCTGEQQ